MCTFKTCRCDVLTDSSSSSTVQNGTTSDTERSLTGLSMLSNNRAATQFDFPEFLTEEPAGEITANVETKVHLIVLVVFTQENL